MEDIKTILISKFEEIERRMLSVLEQLDDEEVNWRPNETSNSIANLIVHISGNINERILNGILNRNAVRNRDEEFEELYRTKQELLDITRESFQFTIETIKGLTKDEWYKTQVVRNKERTHLEVIIQCAAHFSEHLGQVFYIAKTIKDSEYVTTSIPKKYKS
ncbi:DUF1572 family protein [Paenibacillus sp. CF384]|uniref:DUF1572 family protein n=1 Tax=Paenibacillus sp. CF384 TaxID=1884382 RepID=UPI00089628A8|nr:DUF1572 family protein [Paenibacillus sp. CF384]SDW24456.1 Protein of unknown function [Paenibacillus sp. CF384]